MKSKNKKNRNKGKIREVKPSKMFPLLAGIAVLIILCSDVFGDTEV